MRRDAPEPEQSDLNDRLHTWTTAEVLGRRFRARIVRGRKKINSGLAATGARHREMRDVNGSGRSIRSCKAPRVPSKAVNAELFAGTSIREWKIKILGTRAWQIPSASDLYLDRSLEINLTLRTFFGDLHVAHTWVCHARRWFPHLNAFKIMWEDSWNISQYPTILTIYHRYFSKTCLRISYFQSIMDINEGKR